MHSRHVVFSILEFKDFIVFAINDYMILDEKIFFLHLILLNNCITPKSLTLPVE